VTKLNMISQHTTEKSTPQGAEASAHVRLRERESEKNSL